MIENKFEAKKNSKQTLSLFDFKKLENYPKFIKPDKYLNKGYYDNVDFTGFFPDYF